MENPTGPLLDLSHADPDIITKILGSMPLRERFICALVCKAWGEAATAATHSIIIIIHRVQDFSGLQHWLNKHGNGLEVLQLHACCEGAKVDALPCCAKLQDLLLHGQYFSIASRTWADITSATRLTSISLVSVQTASQQADVVAALTALPNLEQLTWRDFYCSNHQWLSNSSLLQHMTWLTSLDLWGATAAALQHLGSLSKLQHLSISAARDWPSSCPGLQELTGLTSLELACGYLEDLPASTSQLTALRQLKVQTATCTALDQLQVLTGLTQLCVQNMMDTSSLSPPLKLPGLQHMELQGEFSPAMPMSFLASCTQLHRLKLQGFGLTGPGSLVASTMLQDLELFVCRIGAADGAANAAPWQQVFAAPGQRLPHLTAIHLVYEQPALQQADINRLVDCCSNLGLLGLDTLQDNFAPVLAHAPGLTNLHLGKAFDAQCSAMVQLTGLKQLTVWSPGWLSAVGLRQLAALNQLTSLGFGRFYHSQPDILAQHLMKDNLPGYPYAIINKVCMNAEFKL